MADSEARSQDLPAKNTKIPYDRWPSNRQPSAVDAEQGTG